VPAVVIGVLIVVAALSYKTLQFSPPALPPPPRQSDATAARPEARPSVQPVNAEAGSGQTSASATAPLAAQLANAPASESIIDAKQLLATLAALDGKEPITAEQAQTWKESLQQLIHQGAASAPAIQQFLAQNLDANYAGVSGAGQLGYNSLRSALLDALGQIGGPEATAAMLQTLQTSIYPTDVATLARTLEAQAPGQFQHDILSAVRRQLSLAALDQLGGANVGPLYQVLAKSGASGGSVSGELAQYAEKWPYYSSIALASLPGNAGVPALIQMAQGTLAGNPAVAAEALAQLAPQNADALNTLVALAKNGQLNDSTLVQLAPFLGGRQYELSPPSGAAETGYLTFHMAGGNQDFSAYDGGNNLSAAQVTQCLSNIDQLLAAIPGTDSAAQDALQQQKTALTARQGPH